MSSQTSSSMQATSAQGLLDSFGVNTHAGMVSNSGYANAALVIRSLNYLGLSSVRDTISTNGAPEQALSMMAGAGIKFDFFAPNNVAVSGSSGVQDFVNLAATFAQAHPGSVQAIEGQNEVDIYGSSFNGDTSLAGAVKTQQALYTDVKANAALSGARVYNMALGYEANYASLGDLSAYSDAANLHFYSGAQTDIAKLFSTSVSLAEGAASRQGFVVTETGFSTSAAALGYSVDQVAQAKMTLTDMLMAYASGSAKTYAYELLDEPGVVNTVAASAAAETAFGLFNADGTAKLAATAVHNFTTLLNAIGGSAVNGSVQVDGLGSDGHALNVSKASGGNDLVIWRDVSSWNVSSNAPVTVQPEQATISFSSPQAQVFVYNPLNGLTPIASYTNVSSITLPVSDTPLVVELGSSAPYAPVVAAAAIPLVTIDAATFVSQMDHLSQESGIASVNLTDSHTLQMASIETMHDVIAHYSTLLGKVAGGYNFNIEAAATDCKIDQLYDSNGALVSTSTYALSGGQFTALSVAFANGATAYYSYTNGVATYETHAETNGSRSTTNYNALGTITHRAEISAQNVTTSWSYDASGTVQTKTSFNADRSGDVWDYNIAGKSYTSDHAVYAAGSVLTSLTRLHADGSYDYVEQHNSDGSMVKDFYNAAGALTQEQRVAADGGVSVSNYDGAGHAILNVDAQNVTTTWSYDASGAVQAKTSFNADRSGDVWDYNITGKSYTSDHYTYAAGSVYTGLTRLHADGSFDYVEQRKSDGSMVKDFYNAAGVMTQEQRVAADGGVSVTNYDGAGHAILNVDAQNVTTSWSYDASGAVQTKTSFNADRSGDVWDYNITGKSYTSDHAVYAAGSVLTSLTRLHANGSFDYVEQHNSDGSMVKDFYNAAGVMTQEQRVAADGGVSVTNYDGAGHAILNVDAQNVTTSWSYDASGAVQTKTSFNADRSGDVWNYNITGKSYTSDHYTYAAGSVYTGLTRLHADGSFDYVEQRKSDGSMVKDFYNAAGVMTQEQRVAADGGVSVTNYDGAGHAILNVDAQNVTTSWSYDASGVVQAKTSFNADRSGDVWDYNITGKSYTSDHAVYAAGSVLTSLTRLHANGSFDYVEQHNSDGSMVKDFYNAAGVMTQEQRVAADGGVSVTNYDGAGHAILNVDAQNVTTSWSYDASGAVQTKTSFNADRSGDVWDYNIAGKSYTSDHAVYAAGSVLTSLTRLHADGSYDYVEQHNSDGSMVKDFYNAAGALTQEQRVAANGGVSVSNYDGAGHAILNVDAQNVTTTWSYDASGAVQAKTSFNADRSGDVWDYNITGKSYTSDHYTYAAGSVYTGLTRLHADGSFDYVEQRKSDGSMVKDFYNAAGVMTQEQRIAPNGGVSTISYDVGGNTSLIGGPGVDRFVLSYGISDTITNFSSQDGDNIDLSRIDAINNNQSGTLDHFVMMPGNTFTGHAGQLIVVQDMAHPDGMHWLIEGDTLGNGHADYVLHLTTSDLHMLSTSDFLLG